MTDHPIFFKLDVNFTEHPRTQELSDKAFRALVELWCYCKRLNTDGKVPMKLYKSYHYEVRKQLANHYVKELPHEVEMVGYLEHQQSAAELADLRKRRAEYGRRGGLAKQKAKQVPEQNSSHIDIDIEVEEDLLGKPSRKGAPRRPLTTLPLDFEVTGSMKLWAQEKVPGVDIERETENFRDWHVSKGNTFKDWEAAWRTWMRRAIQNRPAVAVAEQKKDWWFDS